jgi:glutathione peroxidase
MVSEELMKTGMLSALISVVVILLIVVCHVPRVLGGDVVKDPHKASPSTQPGGALAFEVKDIDGADTELSRFRGDVVLIVNVASKCGYTKQYAGLEKLYEKYKDRGLVVIGFPANNFNGQEPGSNEEIKNFCASKFNVTFPMMSKISVKGDDIHPLYKYLTEGSTAGEFSGEIGWNFTKFLVDRNGNVYARFGSKATPEDPVLVGAIEKGLAAK